MDLLDEMVAFSFAGALRKLRCWSSLSEMALLLLLVVLAVNSLVLSVRVLSFPALHGGFRHSLRVQGMFEDSGETEDKILERYWAEAEDQSFLEQVEMARAAQKWESFIGTVPKLGPGVILLAGGDNDAFERDVIILASHGGTGSSVGFVVNSKLPEEEGNRARDRLREYSKGEEEEIDFKRAKLISNAINNRERLWLGAGGPVKHPLEGWMHLHSCNVPGAEKLRNGIFVGGDILEVLKQQNCFVKLLFGAAVWNPGQLEMEIHNDLWVMKEASSSIIFNKSENPKEVLNDARKLSGIPFD